MDEDWKKDLKKFLEIAAQLPSVKALRGASQEIKDNHEPVTLEEFLQEMKDSGIIVPRKDEMN